jgi:hypothetical protein
MEAVETHGNTKMLSNSAKHFAFSRCGEFNLMEWVGAQIAVSEGELLASTKLWASLLECHFVFLNPVIKRLIIRESQ